MASSELAVFCACKTVEVKPFAKYFEMKCTVNHF